KRIAPVIRPPGQVFVLSPEQRPELPSAQAIAVAHMENRIQVIVSDHILLAGLAIKGKQDELRFIPKETAFNASEEWEKRRVVLLRDGRALLKVNWEERKPVNVRLGLSPSARETEPLNELETVFGAVAIVGGNLPEEIELLEVR